MTSMGGLTFGDPNVDLAVATAARAYGDDLAGVLEGDHRSAPRCLVAAAAAIDADGLMTLAAVSDLVGISPQSVRVARARNADGFRIAQRRALAAIRGDADEGEFGEVARMEALRAALAARKRRQAVAAGTHVPGRVTQRVARKAGFVRRFLAAGWPAAETAHLFDLDQKTVRAVAGG